MNKMISSLLIFAWQPLIAFEKLSQKHLIVYGNPNASIKVIEYFSLSSSKCLKLFKRDFPFIRKKYISTEKVHWIFHPDLTDPLTLQAMACLEQLSEEEKRTFWEGVLENLEDQETGPFVIKAAMGALNRSIPDLDKISFLEKHPSLQETSKCLYCRQLNCTFLDGGRPSKIEACGPNEEDYSRLGKADEEDQFCKVAACPKVYNSAAGSRSL